MLAAPRPLGSRLGRARLCQPVGSLIGAVEQFDAGLDLEACAVDEQSHERILLSDGELAQGVQLAEQRLALAAYDRAQHPVTPARGGGELKVEVVAVAGTRGRRGV